ncbi:MAG: helix-turn-helix domain-containing protein [Nodosilinea sp.]
MPKRLLAQDLDDIWEASPTSTTAVSDNASFRETCYRLRHPFFGGQWQDIRAADFWLTVHDLHISEDFVIQSPAASWGPVSSFFIAGTVKNQHQGLTGENFEQPGGHYLECIQDSCELDHFFAGSPLIRLRFALSPQFLQQMSQNCAMPNDLKPWIDSGTASPFYRQGKSTPEMGHVLNQILQCPYEGFLRQLYLEGKVLELATLQFDQLIEPGCRPPTQIALKGDDIERLHQAREILTRQYRQPPSLLELSRQVGLNDFKLKQGFRGLFGMTVFGFLRELRLEQALMLLADRHLTVQQVAHAVGYSHTGYFAKAFRRKYGISPKAYQLGRGSIVRQA